MICPKCGVTFEDPSFFRCPRCGWQHPDPLSQREGLPWERRREIGRIIALWETTKLLLLSPTTAMRMMRNDRANSAALYFLSMSVVCMTSNAVLFAWFFFGGGNELFSAYVLMYMLPALLLIVLTAVLETISLYVATVAQKNMSLRAALTLYRYCAGGALMLVSVPYLGWMAGAVYLNVLLVIGLMSLCEISCMKAIVLVIWQKTVLACIVGPLYLILTG